MQLIERLKARAENSESYFQQFLAKEDLARIQKLTEMVRNLPDKESFMKEGLYIGWTQNDMRTHELKDTLVPLLESLWSFYDKAGHGEESQVMKAWSAFEENRMKNLIHCL